MIIEKNKVFQFLLEIMINFYLPLKEKLLCRECPLTCYVPKVLTFY